MSPAERYVRGLIDAVPLLASVFDEHVRDNDGLLPHVFMGDVARFALRLNESVQDPHLEASLTSLLEYLEQGVRGDEPAVAEMVAVSFLENLDPEGVAATGLRQRMGFGLRRGLDRIHDT